MSMSVEEKAAMGGELLSIMELVKCDPEICEGAMMGMIGKLALNGENPGVIGELLALALADRCTKKIADALIDGIKNSDAKESGELKTFKEEYNRIMDIDIKLTKKINPNIVASVTPFRTIVGHAFIEAGQRICNGETEN